MLEFQQLFHNAETVFIVNFWAWRLEDSQAFLLRFLSHHLKFEFFFFNFLNLKRKVKCCSLLIFGYEINVSIEFEDYHLANDQAQADSLDVNISFFVSDWSKQLENLALVFLLNALAVVDNRQTYLHRYFFSHYRDFTVSWSELYSVWIQVKEHLLKSPLIRLYNLASLEAFENDSNLDVFHIGFVFLDLQDLVNCYFYVENLDVFLKVFFIFV